MIDEIICNKIGERVKKDGSKYYVIFCACEYDENDNPIDNLDKVAIVGKCIFYSERDEFYGGKKSEDYISPIISNPTWLDLCVFANQSIEKTRDIHHVFFEDFAEDKSEELKKIIEASIGTLDEEVKIYRFSMGS